MITHFVNPDCKGAVYSTFFSPEIERIVGTVLFVYQFTNKVRVKWNWDSTVSGVEKESLLIEKSDLVIQFCAESLKSKVSPCNNGNSSGSDHNDYDEDEIMLMIRLVSVESD